MNIIFPNVLPFLQCLGKKNGLEITCHHIFGRKNVYAISLLKETCEEVLRLSCLENDQVFVVTVSLFDTLSLITHCLLLDHNSVTTTVAPG